MLPVFTFSPKMVVLWVKSFEWAPNSQKYKDSTQTQNDLGTPPFPGTIKFLGLLWVLSKQVLGC